MKKLEFFTPKEFKPDGWIRNQLEIQAKGLCGNLYEMWNDIKHSAWIGGDEARYKNGKQWIAERVPYWLDGFIPMAYLLEDEKLIGVAKKYIDEIIDRQRDNGWICPHCNEENFEDYDLWTVFIVLKAISVYYECSGDERIPNVMYKALKNLYEILTSKKTKLFNWGKYRWFECFVAINMVYKIYKEDWLLTLARIIKKQGKDYNSITKEWVTPLNKWSYDTHIVNICMMLKSEALSCDILGEEYRDNAEYLHGILSKHNGTVFGGYTGDECLSGISPIQGTELCAVAEQMFSFEKIYEYSGDFKWIERLENLAFNAWPATMSEDMNTHQYCQMSNQISTEEFEQKAIFRTNGKGAHVFRVHNCCCTANHCQAWPKLALCAYAHDHNSLISAIPLPGTLDSEFALVKLESDYPFNHRLKYTIKAKKNFTFKIRIPSFSEETNVNGKIFDKDVFCCELAKGEEKILEISLKAEPRFADTPAGLDAVKYGALLFALPATVDDWEYAYVKKEPKLCYTGSGKIPFSLENPPVTIKAKVKKINWGYEAGYTTLAAKLPGFEEPVSDEKEVTLVPYGSAKTRMTELPLVE